MAKNGYVKAYRAWMDDPAIWKDADHIAVWMYLVLNASHEAIPAHFGGKRIELQPGQLITGRNAIAKSTKVNSQKVYRVLMRLKNEHLIEQQTSNQNSLISVVSWDVKQKCEQPTEQRVNNECTTSVHKQESKKVRINKRDSKESLVEKYEAAESLFERLWQRYPKKRGKGAVQEKQKVSLLKVGEAQMVRAIDRYKEQMPEDHQFVQNGGTFFNRGYIDFLDENYQEPSKKGGEARGNYDEDSITG